MEEVPANNKIFQITRDGQGKRTEGIHAQKEIE